MYINDRDQINYHGFLRALRDMHGVSQGSVSKGICTVSGMNRFENGNRVAEKLMRDRLTARLGISGETYEDYLLPKEYEAWEHRMRIVKAIEDRDLDKAKEEIAAYEQRPKLNKLNEQFVRTMQYNILLLEGASHEALFECVTEAIKFTVPSLKKALNQTHLLADQEVNLIAEYMRLLAPKKAIRDENAWRISEYEILISYMDNSRWEKLQKAKVYPKVTYYICTCLMAKDCDEAELRRGLALCEEAIDLLRDTTRRYYFVELLEMRRMLAERLMAEHAIEENERENLCSMLEENSTWECVLKELLTEYNVPVYMSDFCYLYYETECHNMVLVEEMRRTMLGISRAKICAGVCADRTLVRIEREGVNPTMEVMRGLFDKMGLCAEYKRAPIITMDAEILTMDYEKLAMATNDSQIAEGLKTIEYIKNHIDMELPYNKQEISRIENYLLYNAEEISADVFIKREKEALACTLPIKKLESKKKYFTNSEIHCVQELAFNVQTDISSLCLKIVEEKCFDVMEKGMDASRISILELLMAKIASALGNKCRYEESNQAGEMILKECLFHYRIGSASSSIYNKVWNLIQIGCGNAPYTSRNIHRCIVLSEINKKWNAVAFYQNKSRTFKNYFLATSSSGPS